ncbi:response regulator, partial [bacterium]|nr:response regulator [bacterium]
DKAINAGHRAADLTRQMLAYSGKGRYVVGRINLSDLIRESEKLIRAAIPSTAFLDLSLEAVGCIIEADGDQVKHVIMNLLTNAAEAVSDQPGTITVATGIVRCDEQELGRSRITEKPPAGRFVFLDVSDTGCGMDTGTLQRIFEPFFTTRFTGRGLGMSAVLGIVSTHGGAIFTDSTPGRGTSIRVLFPLCETVSCHEDPAVEEAAGPGVPAASSGTILVVDDEEDVREVCSVFVEHLGFKAVTAVDGEDALRIFQKNADRIVCVLMDLTMPRLDGVSAFHSMKEINPGIPVILSSGYSDSDISARFSTLGLAGFIQKPYTLHELEDKILRALKP